MEYCDGERCRSGALAAIESSKSSLSSDHAQKVQAYDWKLQLVCSRADAYKPAVQVKKRLALPQCLGLNTTGQWRWQGPAIDLDAGLRLEAAPEAHLDLKAASEQTRDNSPMLVDVSPTLAMKTPTRTANKCGFRAHVAVLPQASVSLQRQFRTKLGSLQLGLHAQRHGWTSNAGAGTARKWQALWTVGFDCGARTTCRVATSQTLSSAAGAGSSKCFAPLRLARRAAAAAAAAIQMSKQGVKQRSVFAQPAQPKPDSTGVAAVDHGFCADADMQRRHGIVFPCKDMPATGHVYPDAKLAGGCALRINCKVDAHALLTTRLRYSEHRVQAFCEALRVHGWEQLRHGAAQGGALPWSIAAFPKQGKLSQAARKCLLAALPDMASISIKLRSTMFGHDISALEVIERPQWGSMANNDMFNQSSAHEAIRKRRGKSLSQMQQVLGVTNNRLRQEIAIVAGHWIDAWDESGAEGEQEFNMEIANAVEGRLTHMGWIVMRPELTAQGLLWEDYLKWVARQSRRGVPVLEVHGQGVLPGMDRAMQGILGSSAAPVNQHLTAQFGQFPMDWTTLAVPRLGGAILECFDADHVQTLRQDDRSRLARNLAGRIVKALVAADKDVRSQTLLVADGCSATGCVTSDQF